MVDDSRRYLLYTFNIAQVVVLDHALLKNAIVFNETTQVGGGGCRKFAPRDIEVADLRIIEIIGEDSHTAVVEVAMCETESFHLISMRLTDTDNGICHALLLSVAHSWVSGTFELLVC